jgi:hypothetical protein
LDILVFGVGCLEKKGFRVQGKIAKKPLLSVVVFPEP